MFNDNHYANTESQCDACGKQRQTNPATYYGIEGDFCHEYRHGKGCDCEGDDE